MRFNYFKILGASIILSTLNLSAQNAYEISITSYANSRDLKDVQFELFQDGNKVIEQLSKSGTFQFAILEGDGNYKLKALHDEYITKIIHFRAQEYPFINEYEIQDIDIEFHKQTSPDDIPEIGELKWSSLGHVFNVVQVDSTEVYVKQKYAGSEKKLGEIYSNSIDNADELMALKQFSFAKAHYEIALLAKAEDEYAKRKLLELARMKVEEPSSATSAVDKETMDKINKGEVAGIASQQIEGIVFSVQLGAFSQKVDQSTFSEVPDFKMIKYDDYTRVFSGDFKDPNQAIQRKKEMVSKGYKDAWIVQMKNNKRVGF